MTAKVNLQPARVDLYLYRQDYVSLALRVTTRDAENNPIRPDFSEQTGICQIRADADSETVICEFTVAGAADGLITLTMEAVEAAKLIASAVWDLKMITAAGKPRTWFAGEVHVGLHVSKAVVVTP